MSSHPIKLSALQTRLFQAKAERKKSFEDIGKQLGRDEIYVAAIFYGQAKPTLDEIEKLSKYLNIPAAHLLAEFGPQFYPDRGGLMSIPPTDPVLYRLYEMIQVYGYPIKAIIHEKFGDGIMSAIDFSASVEKVEDPKGDRVKLVLDGKFLPYKKW
ncbi:cyanate lyase C-terminal domain-domain-containing protein [Absidia repens]|uniref:Cyanate hydratase n=1 Tax=Absidia repens TaxID=90262 RepID=A0A1X2IZQ7_9FUNG|nr:cyanate lyase C-terminal domain-domain-containing protein [Absidia repens]